MPEYVGGLPVDSFNASRQMALTAFSRLLRDSVPAEAARRVLASTMGVAILAPAVSPVLTGLAARAFTSTPIAAAGPSTGGGMSVDLASALLAVLNAQRFILYGRIDADLGAGWGGTGADLWMLGSFRLLPPLSDLSTGPSKGARRMQGTAISGGGVGGATVPISLSVGSRILWSTADRVLSFCVALVLVSLAQCAVLVHYSCHANRLYYDKARGSRRSVWRRAARLSSSSQSATSTKLEERWKHLFHSLPDALVWPNPQVAVVVCFSAGLFEAAAALIAAYCSGDGSTTHFAIGCVMACLLCTFYVVETRRLIRFALKHKHRAWVPEAELVPTAIGRDGGPELDAGSVVAAWDPVVCLFQQLKLPVTGRFQGRFLPPDDIGSEEPRRTEDAIQRGLSFGSSDLLRCFDCHFHGQADRSLCRRPTQDERAASASTSRALERAHVWLRDGSGGSCLGVLFMLLQTLMAVAMSSTLGFLSVYSVGESRVASGRVALIVLMALQAIAALVTCCGTANDFLKGWVVCAAFLLECASSALVLEGHEARGALGATHGTHRSLALSATAAALLIASTFLPIGLHAYDLLVAPCLRFALKARARAAVRRGEDRVMISPADAFGARHGARSHQQVNPSHHNGTIDEPRQSGHEAELVLTDIADEVSLTVEPTGKTMTPPPAPVSPPASPLPEVLLKTTAVPALGLPVAPSCLPAGEYLPLAERVITIKSRGQRLARTGMVGMEGPRPLLSALPAGSPPRVQPTHLPAQRWKAPSGPHLVTLTRTADQGWGFEIGSGTATGGHRFFVVARCQLGSIAALNGLRKGDRIQSINGRDLADGGASADGVQELKNPETSTLRMRVIRGQRESDMRGERRPPR